MGIMDNEGHDPMGLGNVPTHTGSTALTIELSAASAREDTLRNERDHAISEIKRLRAALGQIETAPQPHDDADRTEWKAAFFIASSLARAALASAHEQTLETKK